MYRERCRPKYTDEQLAEIYKEPWSMQYDWKDHALRQNKTLELAGRFLTANDRTGADLSCGDGYICRHIPHVNWILGDFAPGYAYQGPIEDTIREIPEVDVFICCETIEHLDDPDAVLRAIRWKAKKLILSTPICRWFDENPQHYWSWCQKAVKKMLLDSGWNPVDYEETYADPGYCFQIWGCQ